MYKYYVTFHTGENQGLKSYYWYDFELAGLLANEGIEQIKAAINLFIFLLDKLVSVFLYPVLLQMPVR